MEQNKQEKQKTRPQEKERQSNKTQFSSVRKGEMSSSAVQSSETQNSNLQNKNVQNSDLENGGTKRKMFWRGNIKDKFKHNKVAAGTAILIASGVVCKALGAFFRLPLTNLLGVEGIGIFQLEMSLFAFALVIASGGATAALSKLVAAARAKGQADAAKQYFLRALFVCCTLALALGLLFVVLSQPIAAVQSIDGEQSYLLFVILLPLGAALAVFRGYFQGHENMVPTAVSQVVEQVFKFSFGLLFAAYFAKFGVLLGVLGAFLGLVTSEVVALAYLVFIYMAKISKKSNEKTRQEFLQKPNFTKPPNLTQPPNSAQQFNTKTEDISQMTYSQEQNFLGEIKFSQKQNLSQNISKKANISQNVQDSATSQSSVAREKNFSDRKLLNRQFDSANFLLMFSAAILPLVAAVDAILAVPRLKNAGFSASAATQLFGVQSGIAGTFLNFPLVISMAFATSLLPNISFQISRGLASGAGRLTEKGLKILFLLLLPTTFGLVAVFQPAFLLLYPKLDATTQMLAFDLMFCGAFATIFTGLMQYLIMLLQANGQYKFILCIMGAAGVLKVLTSAIFLAVPQINIFAITIGNILFAGTVCALALWRLKKMIAFKILGKDLLLMAFATICMFLAVFTFARASRFGNLTTIILAILLGVVVYGVFTVPVVLRVFKKK